MIRRHQLVPLIMFILAAVCAVFAYQQREEARAQRNEVVSLHREIKRLQMESEAARAEAAKLRGMIEIIRKEAEEKVAEAQRKTR